MKANIINYRRGRRTQTCNQIVLTVEGVDSKEKAAQLVGKVVTWKTPAGNAISGKVSRVHGSKGAILASFYKGLPGQALGTEASVD
ncbi:50S ribosomal protein L35Ae [uncultured archaeon]|nr:50S ribosomal protein L35Ae [uncultured archaeon]